MNLKVLEERRREIVDEIKTLADRYNSAKDGDWTDADEARWVEVNHEHDRDIIPSIDRLKKGEERAERASSLESDIASVAAGSRPIDVIMDRAESQGVKITGPDRDEMREEVRREQASGAGDRFFRRQGDRELALSAWAKRGRAASAITEEESRAADRIGFDPAAPEFEVPLLDNRQYAKWRALQLRAMSTSATAGGDTIPEGFLPEWEFAQLAFGGVRQVARVIRTATGNALPIPTTDDTTNTGELLAENTGAAEQDVATGAVTLNAYKYSSKLVKVSVELLQDSAFDVPSELGRLLGERIARITNTHFTTGTGSAQPNGVVTAGAEGVDIGSYAGGVSGDDILTLIHSVDPSYRNAASFMLNDSTLLIVRKIKDDSGGTGVGNYLWQAGLESGSPGTIAGHPYTVNQDVADGATSAKFMLFGDFGKYIVRDAAGIRFRRLTERYAEADQEAFVAFSRHDGDLLNAGVNPIKYMTAAS